MIPDIGVMIGAYIFTRMFALARTSNDRVVQAFAILTLLVAFIGMADLVLRGTVGIELKDFTQ